MNIHNNSTMGETYTEKIKLKESIMNKWVNIIIKCSQKNMDVYVNGVLSKRLILKNVPYQNYSDVWILHDPVNKTHYNGIKGFLSNLTYYNSAIGNKKIQDIYYAAPNIKIDKKLDKSTDSSQINKEKYLSINWYFNPQQIDITNYA